MDFEKDLGDEVITEYYDESDYVSSTEHNTPFPSLTLSKKVILECYLHNGQIVSRFSNANIVKPSSVSDLEQNDIQQTDLFKPESVREESVNNENVNALALSGETDNQGCCLLL